MERTAPIFEWKELISYIRVNDIPISLLKGSINVMNGNKWKRGLHIKKASTGYFLSGLEVRDGQIQNSFNAIIINSKGLIGGGVAHGSGWNGINQDYLQKVCTETLKGFGSKWFWDVII